MKALRSVTMILGLLTLAVTAHADAPDKVPMPVLKAPTYHVFIATTGNDAAVGDSTHPVAGFQRALRIIDSLSSADKGDVFAEVVYYSGTYMQVAEQSPQMYDRGGGRNLNVSIRGKGKVILDGKNARLGAGSGVVQLLGSHIYVRNIHARNSPANGMKFGWNWNGLIINSGDIVVEDCEVEGSIGHGIIAGIGIVNAGNRLKFNDPAERVVFRRLKVHQAVNNNDHSKSPWGSAVKFNNLKYGVIEDCLVYENGGEGIDVDNGWEIIIQGNTSYNNRANIYLDKATAVTVRNNLCYYTRRHSTNIFLSMEVYSALVTNFYLTDVDIFNNVLLNSYNGISFWQGTVSAIQRAHFHNIHIRHNTIVGKRKAGSGQLHFTYGVSRGKPVQNVSIRNLSFKNNIVSAHKDSVTGKLVTGPLNPQPQMAIGHNLWSQHPRIAYDATTDIIDTNLLGDGDPQNLKSLIPHADSNSHFVFTIPLDSAVVSDYYGTTRFTDSTNAGAIEMDTTGRWGNNATQEVTVAPSVKIYPNPASHNVFVQSDKPVTELVLIDAAGRTHALNWRRTAYGAYVDVQKVSDGLYWIKMNTGHGVVSKALLIKH